MLINLGLSDRHKCWAKIVNTVDVSKQDGYAFIGDFVKADKLIEIKDGSYVLTYEERGSSNNKKARVELSQVQGESLESLLFCEGKDWALQIRDRAARIVNLVLPSGLENYSDLELLRELSKRGYSATKDLGLLPKMEELLNMSEVGRMLNITREAVYAFHKANSKSGYRGMFPKASWTDPGGGNPRWYRSVIENYQKIKEKSNK